MTRTITVPDRRSWELKQRQKVLSLEMALAAEQDLTAQRKLRNRIAGHKANLTKGLEGCLDAAAKGRDTRKAG